MILGIPVILVMAIALYMTVTLIAAEFLKKVLVFVDPGNTRHSVVLCWCVGVGIYLLIAVFTRPEVTVVSFFFVLLSTGLLSAGYCFVSMLRKLFVANGGKRGKTREAFFRKRRYPIHVLENWK